MRLISLISITIGNSVTSIGDEAFYNCRSLSNVYYTGIEEEWNNINIGYNIYYFWNANTNIYYYSESESSDSGNYWYYDENNNIVIW